MPPEIIRIDVDFDGTIGWNGELIEAGDRAAIETRLAAVAAQPDQPEVHLRPNKLVTYKHVAMIMATAQRLGVTKIGIVGNEQFL
jgi:biopolymer transport protein ExbD